MVAVDGSCNRGPRVLENKNTLDFITLELLSGDRVQNSGLDTEEWNSS